VVPLNGFYQAGVVTRLTEQSQAHLHTLMCLFQTPSVDLVNDSSGDAPVATPQRTHEAKAQDMYGGDRLRLCDRHPVHERMHLTQYAQDGGQSVYC
jgi:hypothetical protein